MCTILSLRANRFFAFRLRDIKISYNHVLNIKARASTIIKTLEKDGLLNEEIQSNILCAKSLDELDHLVRKIFP